MAARTQGAAAGEALAKTTLAAIEAAKVFDWKTASAGRVPRLGADFARLVGAQREHRAAARESILQTAGEHPIGGLLAPYLVDLLADPAAPDRPELLSVLTTIAVGKPVLDRFDAHAFAATLRRSRRDRFAAVAEAGPTALALLDHTDEGMRAAAAAFLAHVQPDGLRARLGQTLDEETAPLPLASALVAFGMSLPDPVPAGDRERVTRFLGHESPRLSLAAAIALSFFPGPADDATLARIEHGLARTMERWPGFPWLGGRLGLLAAVRYIELGDRHRARVIAHAPAMFEGEAGAVRPLARKLVTLLFPMPLAPDAAYSAEQTAALRAMLSCPELVDADLMKLLVQQGLSYDEAEVRDGVGLDLEAPPILSRPIEVDGQVLPFFLGWARWCWGRLDVDPRRLVESGFAELGPDPTIEAFRALVGFAPTSMARIALRLSPEAGMTVFRNGVVHTLRAEAPVRDGARALIEFLSSDGWEVVHDFGAYAYLARGGVELRVQTTNALCVEARLSVPRILAPAAYARWKDAFVVASGILAADGGLDNMLKWWTLELLALLATLSGQPPDAVGDELFRRCYVSWPPSSWRVLYLRALPPDRAEDLALWLLSKQPLASWLAQVVPSERVKARVLMTHGGAA